MIITSAVLSQHTRVTDDKQTDDYDNSLTLQWNCNVRLNLVDKHPFKLSFSRPMYPLRILS